MEQTELDMLKLAVEQALAMKLSFKRAIIHHIFPQIEACARKYSHEQIVEVLNEAGVSFTLRTFRVTLSRARSELRDPTPEQK
ncbi:hypothetical protein [Janthinobacterium sp. HH102]|uniref:hypothetical protein n=1 Tax=Janthinobacterium sp. HH102 TaxID=1537274 RepID=UPI0008745EDC|nr:hypothetical protein [Janthinobacterium sp. HH102]